MIEVSRATAADGEAIGIVHAASWEAAYAPFFERDFAAEQIASRLDRWYQRVAEDDGLILVGAVDDRVRGLRMGGDDYLTKPFALVELVARVEALLRRPAESRETTLRAGPLELDLIERTVKRGDRVIDLLPREFRLLEYMMQRSDQLLTRAMLLEEVWNYKFVPATNLVDVHMGRLRHKVDGPGEVPMIHNVRGAGFILRTGP